MKKGKYNPKNILKLRKELGFTQNEIAGALKCDIKTYRDYEKGKKVPSSGLLFDMYNFYREKEKPVSFDYILGVSDFTTPENDYIGSVTGLSDQGIDGLKYLKQSDHNASEYCGQPGLCVLPLLNKLLHHKSFEFVLRAIHDFMNTDYILPVYHTKKGVIHKPKAGKYKGQNVAYPETIQSQSDFDYMGTNKEIPLQHFARENDIYDNIAIPITKEFMQAVAIQRLGFELEQIKQDMENEK